MCCCCSAAASAEYFEYLNVFCFEVHFNMRIISLIYFKYFWCICDYLQQIDTIVVWRFLISNEMTQSSQVELLNWWRESRSVGHHACIHSQLCTANIISEVKKLLFTMSKENRISGSMTNRFIWFQWVRPKRREFWIAYMIEVSDFGNKE